MHWFDVNKKGLAEILARRGIGWLVYELISNAWDERSTKVDVIVVPTEGRPITTVTVTDDNPEGFQDLSDAWTLFAPSKKKGDAEKRGRFALGEKLVLAMCESASIRTTTGGVLFDHRGRHNRPAWKTATGSLIECDVRMTRAEMAETIAGIAKLIPPDHITTTVNGQKLEPRKGLKIIPATLMTEIADTEGNLKRSPRKGYVEIFKPLAGEVGTIYEMGIPVVETGDAFHVNVYQKVPLNMERDNVTPAYLRDLRGLVVSHGHAHLGEDDKAAPWVTDAISAPTFTDTEALDEILTARFGIDRVAYDPSDREANDIAVSRGIKVIHGGSLPAEVWTKAKEAGLIKPAGQVTPSPRPFSPDGSPLQMAGKLSATVATGVQVYTWIGKKLLGFEPVVLVADDPSWRFRACYGRASGLTLNLAKLGEEHFTKREEIYRLAIHEFAHHIESNHLSEKFHDACCKLGAKLAAFFDEFGGGHLAIKDDRGLAEGALSGVRS